MRKLKGVEEVNSFTKENKIALLYFSLDTCNVCVDLYPKVTELLQKYPKVSFGKIEMDNQPAIMGAYQIFTLPCLLLYIEGKETLREARFIGMDRLEEKLNRYYIMLF